MLIGTAIRGSLRSLKGFRMPETVGSLQGIGQAPNAITATREAIYKETAWTFKGNWISISHYRIARHRIPRGA